MEERHSEDTMEGPEHMAEFSEGFLSRLLNYDPQTYSSTACIVIFCFANCFFVSLFQEGMMEGDGKPGVGRDRTCCFLSDAPGLPISVGGA